MRLPRGAATLTAVATPLPEAVVIEFPRSKIVEPAALSEKGPAWATRPRAVIVDGYVCSSKPTGWCATPAAIDRGHITRLAASRGWLIGHMFEETPLERHTAARTLLDEALERVESRESDGLVVARLKHLAQTLGEAVAAVERISAASGRFVSVCDGIDLDSASGRTVLRLLLGELEPPVRRAVSLQLVSDAGG